MLTLWDERFLEVARLAAGWSKDPRAQVGAVLVDVQKRIASVGYNGFPSGVEDSPDRLNNKALAVRTRWSSMRG
jgi:dCMP deaminase